MISNDLKTKHEILKMKYILFWEKYVTILLQELKWKTDSSNIGKEVERPDPHILPIET